MRKLRDLSLLTLTLGVLVLVTMGGRSGMFQSAAYYSDVEQSLDNTFSAASLQAPTLTAATATDDTDPGTVHVTWTDAGDAADTIQILRSSKTCALSSYTDFFVRASRLEGVGYYDDTGVPVGDYCYKVRGKLANWTSPLSSGGDVEIVPATGTIVIVKQTDVATADTFHFTTSGGNGLPASFDLAGSIAGEADDYTVELTGGGVFMVTEAAPAGWSLYSIDCVDSVTSNSTDSGNTAMIHVEEGETVTCTFVNHIDQQPQTITVTYPTDGADFPSGANITPLATATSGLTVAITVDGSSSSVCHVSSTGPTVIHIDQPDSQCVINFDQAGNGSWSPAPQVQVSVDTVKGSQTIIVDTAAPSTLTTTLATFDVSAHSSKYSVDSSLIVTIAASGHCTVASSSVTSGVTTAHIEMLPGSGICTLMYTSPGNANYYAASPVMSLTYANIPELFPSGDRAASTGSGNAWRVGAGPDAGTLCSNSGTICAEQIWDDPDNLGSLDYIRSNGGSNQYVEFNLSDAPADLDELTSMRVYVNANYIVTSGGTPSCELTVTLHRGSTGATLGTGVFDLTSSTAVYNVDVNTTLSQAEVNDLYIRFENTDGGHTNCAVYYANVDLLSYTTN